MARLTKWNGKKWILPQGRTSDGESNEGVPFVVGDHYKVLERDNDCVLIEKIGDMQSPYFVTVKFLRAISDFQ